MLVLFPLLADIVSMPKIALCGPGGCGKDTAANWFAMHTSLRFCGSTGPILAPLVAKRLGLTTGEALVRKSEFRVIWYEVGEGLRAKDPAYLAREVLKGGDIVAGLRSPAEVMEVRNEVLVDLFVWIDRDVPSDPSMHFGSDLCDIVISNNDTIDGFHAKINALARFAGLIDSNGKSISSDVERAPRFTSPAE